MNKQYREIKIADRYIQALSVVAVFFVINTVGGLDLERISIFSAIIILTASLACLYFNCHVHNVLMDIADEIEEYQNKTVLGTIMADDAEDIDDHLHMWLLK